MPSIFKIPLQSVKPVVPLRAVVDHYELNTYLNYRTLHHSFPASNGYESNQFGVIKAVFRKQGPKLESSKLNQGSQIKWFTEKLPLKSDSVVLDLNCGTGIVSRAIAKDVAQVHGTDISRHLIGYAKTKPLDNVEFKEAEASELPFEDSTFDIVFSRYSFTHICHKREVLDEMRRVCKPGGFIALMDRVIPPELDEGSMMRMEWIETIRDPSHAFFLTPAEMNELFDSNGIQVQVKDTNIVHQPYEEYLDQTNPTPGDRICISQHIHGNMVAPDADYEQTTGFYPHMVDDDVINVTHHTALIGGINPVEKPVKKESEDVEQKE